MPMLSYTISWNLVCCHNIHIFLGETEVTVDNIALRLKVIRKDWKGSDQDGGEGSEGTIIQEQNFGSSRLERCNRCDTR